MFVLLELLSDRKRIRHVPLLDEVLGALSVLDAVGHDCVDDLLCFDASVFLSLQSWLRTE